MMRMIPSHLARGKCSPKKSIIQIAVNTGRILLNAFACVTPTLRSAKQKRINAATLAKTLRYPTHHNAVINCELSIVHCPLSKTLGPSLKNQIGMKKQRLMSWV